MADRIRAVQIRNLGGATNLPALRDSGVKLCQPCFDGIRAAAESGEFDLCAACSAAIDRFMQGKEPRPQ